MHTQDGNRDRKDEMINLTKFRMIADIISEIKLYQNERYNFAPEDSIQVRIIGKETVEFKVIWVTIY